MSRKCRDYAPRPPNQIISPENEGQAPRGISHGLGLAAECVSQAEAVLVGGFPKQPTGNIRSQLRTHILKIVVGMVDEESQIACTRSP